MKSPQKQILDNDIVVIQYVTSPEGKHLVSIPFKEIGMFENSYEIVDYFSIDGDTIYFNSKAKYSSVKVFGVGQKAMEEINRVKDR